MPKRLFRATDIRPNARRDVADELRFHLDMRTQEFIDAGVAPDEARRAAARAFGDIAAIDAELRAARAERTRSRARRDRVQESVMDVRFALRTLRSNLAFTIAALATLALGIGSTTAVFTVVNGVLLRPLPYADPSRLVMLWMTSRQPDLDGEMPLASGYFFDLQRQSTSFANVAAFRSWGYTLRSTGRDAEQVPGARISPALLPVLGVHPIAGREFADADAAPGAPHVVLISYALWQRQFGGRASVVGTRVQMSGEWFTIVGIMPPGFAFPRGAELPSGLQFGARTDVWTPLVFTTQDRREYSTENLAVIGRLKPGVTRARARDEINAQLHNFLQTVAPTLDLSYDLLDLRTQAGSHVRRSLLLLLGAVALVLFIACANVTNLLVARTSTRRREFAVRAALGAGRGRLARQLVTENVLLAVLGTVIGIAAAVWATRTMLALVPGSLPRAADVTFDWRVGLATAVIAMVAGTAFGAAAAIQIRFGRLADTLRDDSGRATSGRSKAIGRRVLVATEVAVSLMLLIGAALLSLSFVRLQHVDPGFDPSRALTADITLPLPSAFNPSRDGPAWARFFRQLDERLASTPGIQAVGAVSSMPLTGAVESSTIFIAGEPRPAAGQGPHAQYAVVEGDYFHAIGIRVLQGRAFDSRDAAGAVPVIMVNREFVRRHLHDANAVGRRITCLCDFTRAGERTIIGVVDDVRQTSLDSPATPQVYLPESQMPYPELELVARAAGDPRGLAAVVRRAVKAIDPTLAVTDVRTLDDVFSESLARQRFSMTIIAIFAVSALVLAIVGLYGVIALSVGQRRREIGVRLALGARPSDVLRLVLGDGLRITIAGVLLGLAGAVAMSRVLRALLFDVSATNAGIYAAASAAVMVVTLAATYVPARRATAVDPTMALRAE